MRRYKSSDSKATLLLSLLIVALFFSITISVISFYKLYTCTKGLDSLKKELSKTKSELSKRIGRVEDLVGPNSPLDRYINDFHYVKNVLSDLKNFEKIISELDDNPRSGYFKVLVVGAQKVWFEVEGNGKKLFAGELFPGISPYKFYYFKAPDAMLDYIIKVPPSASITVGKPDRVFLIFFGVGTSAERPVKIVKLSKTRYVNIEKSFNLYIPK